MEQHVNSDKAAGFTLIEFSVATLIMMVGLLGLLQAVNLAARQNLGNMLRNEAIAVADEQMVMARTAAITVTGFSALASATSTTDRKIRGGNVTYTVNRVVTTKSPKSKEVVIKVTWSYKGASLERQLSSLVVSPL